MFCSVPPGREAMLMLISMPPPLVAASQIVNPVVILVLCVVAGVGTVLMLPGRKETAWSKVGGVIALAVCLIFGALLVRFTATQNNGGMGVYFWLFSFLAIV